MQFFAAKPTDKRVGALLRFSRPKVAVVRAFLLHVDLIAQPMMAIRRKQKISSEEKKSRSTVSLDHTKTKPKRRNFKTE